MKSAVSSRVECVCLLFVNFNLSNSLLRLNIFLKLSHILLKVLIAYIKTNGLLKEKVVTDYYMIICH